MILARLFRLAGLTLVVAAIAKVLVAIVSPLLTPLIQAAGFVLLVCLICGVVLGHRKEW